MVIDLEYQLLLLLIDLLLVAAVALRTTSVRWYWFVLAFLTGLLAAWPLASDGFHMLRLVSWLLFLHLPLTSLAIGISQVRRRRGFAVSASVLAVVMCGIGIYSFLIEPYALEVSRHQIISSRVPEPVRIALIADLQTDEISSYEDDVLRSLTSEEPDLILFLGDYVQLSRQEFVAEIRDFQELLAKHDGFGASYGTFAVEGNADPRRWWIELFQHSDVTTLERTESIQLNDWLTITGLDVQDSFNASLHLSRPSKGFHVVFGHGPDYALGDVDADLLVAGHTHGGQVQLPFLGPILTLSKVPRDWASGRTHLGHEKTLFVSRGVGMERGLAPRLRFLCRPEIVIIDVIPT